VIDLLLLVPKMRIGLPSLVSTWPLMRSRLAMPLRLMMSPWIAVSATASAN
jgi:hypothetical protein